MSWTTMEKAHNIIDEWHETTMAAGGDCVGYSEDEWTQLETLISNALAQAEVNGLREAAEVACNQCLCPADVAYDNGLSNQTQGDSYNMACMQIFDKLLAKAKECEALNQNGGKR